MPIRVLITTPNLDTAGSKYVIKNIVEELDRSVFAPSLCVHRRTYSKLELELEQITDSIIELPLRSTNQPYRRLLENIRSSSTALKGHFDVVHSLSVNRV